MPNGNGSDLGVRNAFLMGVSISSVFLKELWRMSVVPDKHFGLLYFTSNVIQSGIGFKLSSPLVCLWSIFYMLLKRWFIWNESVILLFLLLLSVPLEAPQNLTVNVNNSMLMIRWEAPPPDKLNGVLQGYDVTIKHGTRTNKVSNWVCQLCFVY